MKTIYLNKKDIPAHLIRGETGQKFNAQVTESITLHNTYWSGGTKSNYYYINMLTGQKSPVTGTPSPHHFGGDMEGRKVIIEPNRAIVEYSTFCGKDMGLTFYIHPDNAQQLIPAPCDITDNQKIVLEYTARYKNSYGGKSNIRFCEARQDRGITESDWDSAKQACIDAGYLRKNGSITPDGRNAA